MSTINVVKSFVKAVNDHNVERLYDLMSEDHIFIDGYGNSYKGRMEMKEGWINYYKLFPDYNIEITEYTENETMIGLFGYAEGTYKKIKNDSNDNHWRTPAAWKAIVENKKIKLWQVFCDYSKLLEMIARNQQE